MGTYHYDQVDPNIQTQHLGSRLTFQKIGRYPLTTVRRLIAGNALIMSTSMLEQDNSVTFGNTIARSNRRLLTVRNSKFAAFGGMNSPICS